MATREWIQAEREKAAQGIVIANGTYLPASLFINLQCEINFLRAQVEEARELLTKAKEYTYCDIDCGCPGVALTKSIGTWLDRNPETK